MIVLAVALTVAGMVYLQSSDAKREAQVVGWARSLVWQALGLPVTPRFIATEARKDRNNPGRWVVSGDFEAEGGSGQAAGSLSFVAALRQVCGDLRNRECWSLQDLVVEDRAVVDDAVLDLKALSDLGFRPQAVVAAGSAEAAPEGQASGEVGQSGARATADEQGSAADAAGGAEVASVEDEDPLEPEGGYRPLERAPLPRARPTALGP